MKLSVLFSSGKDSSLAAILMQPFYNVELVTINFGILPSYESARLSAVELGFPHRVKMLDQSMIKKATDMLIEDGFPGRAINFLHRVALEAVCSEPDTVAVADGTRRDDRVPILTIDEIRSMEDRHNIIYIQPLRGFGRSAVNTLVNEHLLIDKGDSDEVDKADYEAELRWFIRKQYNEGNSMVKRLFPGHIQSHVISRKYS